ncbi:MAG TPA: glutamate formimidoyltransferase [Phycisphaerae bacterium]|nr:glutamate formimidoyltransferase [Phycisphaerae bacterium]HNU45945.1 glutamate formimidoyltransferase [Phycisphaerae bacterium]
MTDQLIECVPNFSEGRDRALIKQITDQIETVEGVKLLDVDPGQATNRTVVTFVGPPEPVLEAAVRAARKAAEVIDMRKHHGAHPRFGAMDVCPLVPVANITMEETAQYAHRLAKRLADEVGMTIYCYEFAARSPERRNLATVRAGEYEGLAEKLRRPEWKPDFGPATFNAKLGATAVGARNFLVAYNVNLNTTSTRRANAIAYDVRERGRVKTVDGTLTGTPVLDEKGEKVWEPGTLKSVKAIGWYIEEYGIAQISINLTDLTVTPVHIAFDEVCEKAQARGVRVTGSELVGLIPLHAMLEAGRYFLRKQQRSLGVCDEELIKIAVKSLGLNDLYPFKPDEKIIEYAIAKGQKKQKRLVDMTVKAFVHETASESPAPGGGSIAATMGAFGAALGTMVANLSSHKRGWDERWEEFSDWAVRGKEYHDRLLRLIDEDTDAFNRLMAAFGLPKGSDEEKAARKQAIQEATRHAIEVPLQTMQTAFAALEVIEAMAKEGNPASVSDAGVGALAARSAVMGAFLNVKINAGSIEDKQWLNNILTRAGEIREKAIAKEREILEIVNGKM